MFQVWPPWWASRQQKPRNSCAIRHIFQLGPTNSWQTVKIFNFGLFASIVVRAAILRQLCPPPAHLAPEHCVPGWCGAGLQQGHCHHGPNNLTAGLLGDNGRPRAQNNGHNGERLCQTTT